MVGEVVQVFWAAVQSGEFIAIRLPAAGTYRNQGTRWVIESSTAASSRDVGAI